MSCNNPKCGESTGIDDSLTSSSPKMSTQENVPGWQPSEDQLGWDSLNKFYCDAKMVARKTGWRYGQAVFNHLAQVKPSLAEAVRGTDKDPYYVENLENPNWGRFVSYIEANWSTQDSFRSSCLLIPVDT